MAKRIALYARTGCGRPPTADSQLDLLQSLAAHRDWEIIATHTDTTQISPSGRDRRPGLDNLLRLVRSSGLDLIATHSLDRLGRSLADLVHILAELRARHVDLYLYQQAIDTATPSGHTLFEAVGIFIQYERALARERVIAGQRRAALAGVRIGRPPLATAKLKQARAALNAGRGVRETARLCGISLTAVHRLKSEMAVTPVSLASDLILLKASASSASSAADGMVALAADEAVERERSDDMAWRGYGAMDWPTAAGIALSSLFGYSAWLTSIVFCAANGMHPLMIADAAFFPVGVVHGVGVWFGGW